MWTSACWILESALFPGQDISAVETAAMDDTAVAEEVAGYTWLEEVPAYLEEEWSDVCSVVLILLRKQYSLHHHLLLQHEEEVAEVQVLQIGQQAWHKSWVRYSHRPAACERFP